jgi:hypothetical protein
MEKLDDRRATFQRHSSRSTRRRNALTHRSHFKFIPPLLAVLSKKLPSG